MAVRPRRGDKLDLYRGHKDEYAAPQEPAVVKVGPALYLVVAGKGSPGGPEFRSAMGSLFGAAYTLKFLHKARGRDFKVSGPEGLWGAPPRDGPFRMADLAKLPWRLILRVPEFVTKADLAAALQQLAKKGRAGGDRVTLERLREGTCVQMLHVGPYSTEPRTVRAIDAFARSEGFSVVGPHHEIYLSDPRRVAPGRLRTILRYPIRKARHPP
jgi:hypothetical protein